MHVRSKKGGIADGSSNNSGMSLPERPDRHGGQEGPALTARLAQVSSDGRRWVNGKQFHREEDAAP